MKKSKAFLGVTACALTAVGLIAAKAGRNHNKLPGYYTSSAGNCTAFCAVYFTVNSASSSSNFATCQGHTLFTVKKIGVCSGKVLFTQAKD